MKFFLPILLFFCLIPVEAQTSLVDSLHAMQTRPVLKEKVYLHTNKTTYFSDDIIWFKAYVGDSINYPSVQTRKLHVDLIHGNGDVIFSRSVKIGHGTGSGQFELDDSVAPGTYYIQAQTNYMRNFGADYRYLQSITILGQKTSRTRPKAATYDVQFLPEGGHPIEDIDNIMAVKATKNGQSIDFKGTIFNNQDRAVTTFQSEHSGMGSFRLNFERGQRYRARLQLKDTVLDLALPAAAPRGVALHVDPTDPLMLRVYLKTNETTFYDQVYSNYALLFHQDRQLIDLVFIARLDSLTGLIEKRRDRFLEGVNTVTLFADDQPIAERKFYVDTPGKKATVTLGKTKASQDSTGYTVSLHGKRPLVETQLSVSVLKGLTLTLNQENTIQSAFLLQPFLKGHIENPAYYFDSKNPDRKAHLDLLLRTQGWTDYSIKDWIARINPKEKYVFEKGFELKGTLQGPIRNSTLVLIPEDFRIRDKVKLKGRPDFVFENLDVTKGDTIKVAYRNWLGKIIKPLNIAYDTTERKSERQAPVPDIASVDPEIDAAGVIDVRDTETITSENSEVRPIGIRGTINLDEVIVSETKRDQRYTERRKIIKKYKPLVNDIGRYTNLPISDVMVSYGRSLQDFMHEQGYTLNTSNASQDQLQGVRGLGRLYINGRYIQPQELRGHLQTQMKDISNVMVYYTTVIWKRRRVKLGHYQVFIPGQVKTLFDRFVIKNGFDRSKKYYTPLHHPQTDLIREVDWKPRLKTNAKGETSFSIAKDSTAGPTYFFIQGFSNEGHLISETIAID